VTGLVDALEAAGFVARKPHPTDRRATLVTLTDDGEALVAPWHADRDQSGEQLFAGTSTADLTTFVTVMDRVLRTLRENDESD
jgi:DNA-binding MarR family transcriptional regulator